MNTFRLALASLFVSFALAAPARAQEPQPAVHPPTVNVSLTARGVRFVALGGVRRMRVEALAADGTPLGAAAFKPGSVYDWTPDVEGAGTLGDGNYRLLVTIVDAAGGVSTKQCAIRLAGGEASLTLGEAEPAGEAAERRVALAEPDGALALTAHDGRDGQLVSTRGALSFRLGDLFSGGDTEAMRLDEKELSVAGAVRASGGFVFPDGTRLNSSGGRLSLTSAAGDEIPGPNAAGTGTANRIAKWAETGGAGTLTNSTFEEDASGNVFNFFGSRVAVGGQQPFFEAQRGSAGDILQRFWNTGAGGAKLRYVAGTGATSQIQLTDNMEWLSSIAGNNQIGLQFRVRAVGSTNSEAGLDSSAVLTLARTGNVGVGIAVPTSRLHVAGTARVEGDLTVTGNITGTLPANSASYIQNTTTPQGSSNFNISGNGTAGGTLTAGGLTVDTNTLFVDAANNRVGVGTATPAAALDVAGNLKLTGAGNGVTFPDASVQTTAFKVPLTLSSAADTTLRVNYTGTSASHALAVSSSSDDASAVTVTHTGGNAAGVFRVTNPNYFAYALLGASDSPASGVSGVNSYTMGAAGVFEIQHPNNASPALWVETHGTGPAGKFIGGVDVDNARLRVTTNAGAAVVQLGDRYRDNAVIAWAKVTGSSGAVANTGSGAASFGVASVTKLGTGSYEITLSSAPADPALLIPVAIAEVEAAPASAGAARIVSINQIAGNSTKFHVYITSGTFASVDNDFVFMVTGR